VVTLTKLADAEYLLGSVVHGLEEYYLGVGEAPGVWAGAWAHQLGLEGLVEADDLRSLLDGVHPLSGEELTVGLPDRKVRAIDVTFSAPKSVSTLWALGSAPVAETVMHAHVEAVATALGFLESHAAVARRQVDGVRRQVSTEGLAVAGFVHRTSREADPQLHTHCLTVNLTRRVEDGRVVALDAAPLYGWARAAGSVYQAVLQRALSLRLGVEWGPDRHNTREIAGFEASQLRVFSKRTALIEAELQQLGAAGVVDPGLRARVDDAASLATRRAKERQLTPAALVGRWEGEAGSAGLAVGDQLDRAVCYRSPALAAPSFESLTGLLVDRDVGVCARSARFTEADVIEHLCAQAAGRLTLDEIQAHATRFLGSDLVVRLVPDAEGRRLGEWSTVAHRALEDRVIGLVDHLAGQARSGLGARGGPEADLGLGPDQREAVGVLCGPGPAVRCVLAPAGFGKTAMVATAARVAGDAGHRVLGVATTAKAVAELDGAGVASMTIAGLRVSLDRDGPLAPGTVIVLDEVSQTSTRDAETVLAAIAACAGGQLWVLGDPRQGQPVLAGGLAHHLATLTHSGRIPAATLVENRRQLDPQDREALRLLRAGRPDASQTIRTEHGWEHDCGSPIATRQGLVEAAVDDIAQQGEANVVVLCVSHADAEDLADRIRHHLVLDGKVQGPAVEGPGWAGPRLYQQGDRILFHTRFGGRSSGIVNGTTATVLAAGPTGLTVRLDGPGSPKVEVSSEFVQGTRPDGSPNLSHAWARTIDGAQGGTWRVAHLLGTPALDQYRGYVGQSRSQHPTHTWNTSPSPVIDHGGVPADQREAGEHVLAALTRTPETSLAATSDPFALDRHLQALIAAHQAVLADRPPDRSVQLILRETAVREAQQHHAEATHRLEKARAERDNHNPLGVLSRHGRAERRTLDRDFKRAEGQFASTAAKMAKAERELSLTQSRQAERDAFTRREGWRDTEVTRLRAQLDAHWAEVAVSCARADDPLAYGVDVLRRGLAHHTHRLEQLEKAIPPDRSHQWRQARHGLTAAINDRDQARRDIADARQRLEAATAGRWRSRPAETAAARADLDYALHRLRTAATAETELCPKVERLAEHERNRLSHIKATAQERHDHAEHRTVIHDALDRTLDGRVRALAVDPPEHLARALGPVPGSDIGRAVWCHHARRLENLIDRGEINPQDLRPLDGPRHHIKCAQRLDPEGVNSTGHDDRGLWAGIAHETARRVEGHRRDFSAGIDIS
jgi:conjugative relaxase-like TrwC/TraI family protein